MAKIIDPDVLTVALNSRTGANEDVVLDTTARTIRIYADNNISNAAPQSTSGVTLQCLYSFLKEEWRTNATLITLPFPMVAITEEKFDLINLWDFVAVGTDSGLTRNVIRDAGWSLRDSSNVSEEEYMGVVSLGAFDDSAADQAYYIQSGAEPTSPTNTALTGEVNQAIKIYGDATHGNVDYRSSGSAFFKIFLRERGVGANGKTFADYDLPTEQNLTSIDYKVYKLPLSNGTDVKIAETDANIAANTPYTGMGINYYATGQSRNVGGTPYNFSIIINGNNGTAEQIYEFVQYQLRQNSNIDSDVSETVTGKTADILLEFSGDNLTTVRTSDGRGVYIDNYNANDTNRLFFTDDTGTIRNEPFVSAGTLAFNANAVVDPYTYFSVFFTDPNKAALTYTDGTVAISDTTFTPDVAPSWSINEHAGRSFIVESGNNVGTYTISSNTATELTITPAFSANGSTTGYIVDGNEYGTTSAVLFPTKSTGNLAGYLWTNQRTGGATGDTTVNGQFTASDGAFTSADIGRAIHITSGTSTGTRAVITSIDSGTQVQVDIVQGAWPASETSLNWEVIQSNTTRTWDYDYENDTTGGRTANQDVPITVVAVGLDVAQFVSTTSTVTKTVGQTISVVSALERNYANPA